MSIHYWRAFFLFFWPLGTSGCDLLFSYSFNTDDAAAADTVSADAVADAPSSLDSGADLAQPDLGRGWTQADASGPPPLVGASMAFDEVEERFYLFGGADTTGQTQNLL